MVDSDLYVFIDESGNFDFSPRGTKYFILTALVTQDPVQGAEPLLSWRHHILTCDESVLRTKRARDCTHFHCTEDAQYTRDGVFWVLSTLSFEVHSVILQKNKANPAIQLPECVYEKAFGGLVKGMVRRKGTTAKVHIFASSFKLNSKKAAFIGNLKAALGSEPGLKYHLHFHPTQSHHMLQASDYACWAIARKWESNDIRSYELIESKVQNEFDYFRRGTTLYY